MSQRVLLDANVLHPIVLCDLLIRLARKGLYQPLWSPAILEETNRSILRRRTDLSPDVLGRRLDAMTRALPEAMVDARTVTSALAEQAPATRRPPLSVADILAGLTPFAPTFARAAGAGQPR